MEKTFAYEKLDLINEQNRLVGSLAGAAIGHLFPRRPSLGGRQLDRWHKRTLVRMALPHTYTLARKGDDDGQLRRGCCQHIHSTENQLVAALAAFYISRSRWFMDARQAEYIRY
jgi:hypothetical protein